LLNRSFKHIIYPIELWSIIVDYLITKEFCSLLKELDTLITHPPCETVQMTSVPLPILVFVKIPFSPYHWVYINFSKFVTILLFFMVWKPKKKKECVDVLLGQVLQSFTVFYCNVQGVRFLVTKSS